MVMLWDFSLCIFFRLVIFFDPCDCFFLGALVDVIKISRRSNEASEKWAVMISMFNTDQLWSVWCWKQGWHVKQKGFTQVSGWMIGQRELLLPTMGPMNQTSWTELFWDFFLGREKKGQEGTAVNLDMLLEMTPYLEEVTLSPNRRATWKNKSWLVKRTISSMLPEILQKTLSSHHLILDVFFFLWSRS